VNKFYYTLFVTIAFNTNICCSEYKVVPPSSSWKGVSVQSAIDAAKPAPAPALAVPVRPVTTGSAFLPGFVHQFAKMPTTGTIAKK